MNREHRVLEDITHQLRGPLAAALALLNRLLQQEHLSPDVAYQIRMIRGLCKKANRIAGSASLIDHIDSIESSIRLIQSNLQRDNIIEILLQAAQDYETLSAPYRQIHIRVNNESLKNLPDILVDPQLFELAVYHLIDNASKYSFPNTDVHVSAKHRKDGVYIEVRNYGIQIHAHETVECLKRGWRSHEAEWVTGEGAGLGLWIVDHIMKAHQGKLLVSPTDDSGVTIIELVFPFQKEKTTQ